ncbi:hypothetical protein SDC9_63653 [bioreactor metagenome]|uniref:DUF3846 domain-containing protein n=1 Tax=bioreactor metagenome TaxID=1076179 RepID=A0A644XM62_9ZZZZ
MNVLIVEPEKVPREAEIGSSLKDMQEIVDGYIEAVYPYDDPVALVCNEEGKLNGLPLNRKLEDYDIIAGTFFICGLKEDNFDSLPPDLMTKYKEKFAQPEQFVRLGRSIIAVPMEPENEPKQPRQKKEPGHDER